MLVKRKDYNDLLKNVRIWRLAYSDLQCEWNDLVNKVNAKGGDSFLEKATIGPKARFSKAELREIRVLCHPDKHGGNENANRITQKLNSLIG